LEDLACKFLEPEDYRALARKVKAKKSEREETIERLRIPLAEELGGAGLTGWEITGRPKNLWSIYKKMKKRDKPFEEIYDLLAVRVLVNSITDCYHVLGIIHHTWTPLQERIKDYIASPKSTGYQSLHTTVFGPAGQLYEIQIRTRDMHRTAEYGIAAHWLYKENGKGADELDHHLSWFRQLIELQQDAHSPEEFLEFLKIDLYQDEIFVFTPRGDVKRLPKGATPIDFAFIVHTEVGQHCNGARVNGRIAPLHRALRNGDTIEVLTSPQAKPSRDWLAHVQTGRARQKIRQWIKQEEQQRSVTLGREILAREVRRRRLDPPTPEQLTHAAETLSLGVAEQVEASIGRGDVQLGQVMKAIYPELPADDAQAPPAKSSAFGRVIERLRLGRGIKIHGVEGLMVRYAQCCQPVPGDPVVGYVTQGRGISIHRNDCPNLLTLSGDEERRVEIDWQEVEGETFVVRLAVSGEDRRGLYADICEAISGTGTNIRSAELASKDGVVYGSLLGGTGSGKTMTMAHVIADLGRPTLVLSHNKTLAAQLYGELKTLFPASAVEFFISYYDYYQPEAYVPATDTYIAKDSSINDDIERLRLRATSSLMERDDVVIVASVSAIYGLGDPELYRELLVTATKGESRGRDALLADLVAIQYQRNDIGFERGTFRVRGDTVEIFPAYDEQAVRVEFWGDEIERIAKIDPLTGNVIIELERCAVYPATHFVTQRPTIERAVKSIRDELRLRLAELRQHNKLLEAQRLESRTQFDIDMLLEVGRCAGIENYSRHFSGRQPGERPACLLDYFPDDYLCVL